jgi:thymidylate synthase (FAD)
MIFRSDIDVKVMDVMGNDQYIIAAMKTLPEIPPPDQSDRGRIRYLMEHRHGTPFEHNAIMLVVSAPIFVWREWHRHRIGFSYNEESARYKKLDPVFFIPRRDRKMVKVDENWKPGRPKFLTLDEKAFADRPQFAKEYADMRYNFIIDDMKRTYESAYECYERQLDRGLDPGLARDNLPVGIYSTCYVTCNLRSALAFLSLRTHEPLAKFVSYPLLEIEEAARWLEKTVAERFPLAYEAFCDFGRVGP